MLMEIGNHAEKWLYPEFDGTMFHKTNLKRVRK
jgi:hypothetical protein